MYSIVVLSDNNRYGDFVSRICQTYTVPRGISDSDGGCAINTADWPTRANVPSSLMIKSSLMTSTVIAAVHC